jgi:hypothetical protein
MEYLYLIMVAVLAGITGLGVMYWVIRHYTRSQHLENV